MHENNLARTTTDRTGTPRDRERRTTTAGEAVPPVLTRLVAPALLAVAFR